MKKESTIDPQEFQERYDEAINQNDSPSVAKLFTDDAIFVTDGGPVYGRQAIENGMQTCSSSSIPATL
jgi:uncharacterized protein (TIGR02246 family)